MQNLRKERLTFLDATILRNINLEDLIPVDIDDEQIFENEIGPAQSFPLTTGFNIHSRVFWASLGHSEREDSPADARSRLHSLKYMLDTIPRELRQWPSLSHSTKQIASIRANLHVTHLWLQSILLDQLEGEQVQWAEREDISRQLLHVLHNIPHESLEPNGLHLVRLTFLFHLIASLTDLMRRTKSATSPSSLLPVHMNRMRSLDAEQQSTYVSSPVSSRDWMEVR